MTAMSVEELLERIRQDHWVLSGKPTVRGLRVSAGRIVNSLAAGMSRGEIRAEFPELTEDDIDACELYAVKLILSVRRAADDGTFDELRAITEQTDSELLDAVLNYADHLGQRLAQLPRSRAG
jgi:uncharacterized protein (DUF433 family)